MAADGQGGTGREASQGPAASPWIRAGRFGHSSGRDLLYSLVTGLGFVATKDIRFGPWGSFSGFDKGYCGVMTSHFPAVGGREQGIACLLSHLSKLLSSCDAAGFTEVREQRPSPGMKGSGV